MRFRIDRVALVQAVTLAIRTVAQKTTLPALTCLKVTCTSTGLNILGSNSSMVLSVKVPVQTVGANGDPVNTIQVIETGEILIPAKLFGEIIKKCTAPDIEIIQSDMQHIQIKSGRAKFQITGLDVTDYPLQPRFETTTTFSITKEQLRDLVGQTHFAAANDELSGVLTGVSCQISEGKAKLTATDTKRLAQKGINLGSSDTRQNDKETVIVIPSKNLNEIQKTFGDGPGTINIAVAPSQIKFEDENKTFYSKLLQGVYPDVNKVIPKESRTILKVNKAELTEAAERASLISKEDDENNIITLTIQEEKLVIESVCRNIGNMREELKIKSHGPELKISFNCTYVLDAIKVVQSEMVEMRFNEYMNPCVIKPETELEEEETLQLIVPILTH